MLRHLRAEPVIGHVHRPHHLLQLAQIIHDSDSMPRRLINAVCLVHLSQASRCDINPAQISAELRLDFYSSPVK